MATGELDGGFSRLVRCEKALLRDVIHPVRSDSEGRLDPQISIPVCSSAIGGNHHALLVVRIEEQHLEHRFPKLPGLPSQSEDPLAQHPAETHPVQNRRCVENDL